MDDGVAPAGRIHDHEQRLVGLGGWIDPEKTSGITTSLGVRTNKEHEVTLSIRRGVLEAVDGIAPEAELVIEASQPAVVVMVFRDLFGAFAQAVADGCARTVKGDQDGVRTYVLCFGPPKPESASP
ncbi:hypothetical protein [Streptomyces sp. BE230]|uniref:hypothetical protein n=1 Tax=Streptomyces sp. BE230 TaxID=3002526 RepID=UPI002ED51708